MQPRPLPTKDALLFELQELTVLACPQPPRAATLRFAPKDDGQGVALIELTAHALDGAAPRPDLGYDEDELHAGIADVLSDLSALFASERGEPLSTGQLTVVEDIAQGGVIFTTTDEAGAVVHRRHVDRSERTEQVHSAALFALLAAHMDDERALVERSRALSASGARFSLDTERAEATITLDDGAPHTHGAHAIATYRREESSLSWAWSNEALPTALTARVDEIRRAVKTPGLAAFTREELTVPEKMARRLIAHAAARLGASAFLVVPVRNDQGAPMDLTVALTPR